MIERIEGGKTYRINYPLLSEDKFDIYKMYFMMDNNCTFTLTDATYFQEGFYRSDEGGLMHELFATEILSTDDFCCVEEVESE